MYFLDQKLKLRKEKMFSEGKYQEKRTKGSRREKIRKLKTLK